MLIDKQKLLQIQQVRQQLEEHLLDKKQKKQISEKTIINPVLIY